jgi:hypothetical protein
MAYQMIARTQTFSPQEKRKWLEDSRKRLLESYQLVFGWDTEGNVVLGKPLSACYFYGSPDNKLGGTAQTEEEMFYERKSNFPEWVRKLWYKLFPPTKVGMYVKV